MEKVLANQPKTDNDSETSKAIKVLELNINHPLVETITKLSDDEVKDYSILLYEEAMLLEGYEIGDRKAFVEKLNKLLIKK